MFRVRLTAMSPIAPGATIVEFSGHFEFTTTDGWEADQTNTVTAVWALTGQYPRSVIEADVFMSAATRRSNCRPPIYVDCNVTGISVLVLPRCIVSGIVSPSGAVAIPDQLCKTQVTEALLSDFEGQHRFFCEEYFEQPVNAVGFMSDAFRIVGHYHVFGTRQGDLPIFVGTEYRLVGNDTLVTIPDEFVENSALLLIPVVRREIVWTVNDTAVRTNVPGALWLETSGGVLPNIIRGDTSTGMLWGARRTSDFAIIPTWHAQLAEAFEAEELVTGQFEVTITLLESEAHFPDQAVASGKVYRFDGVEWQPALAGDALLDAHDLWLATGDSVASDGMYQRIRYVYATDRFSSLGPIYLGADGYPTNDSASGRQIGFARDKRTIVFDGLQSMGGGGGSGPSSNYTLVYDTDDDYSYFGRAPEGTLSTDEAWYIRRVSRLDMSEYHVLTGVAWSERLSLVYGD